MLPTNVMSFMKKMVTTEPTGAASNSTEAADSGTTFGKIRQTLSSSLMTAQDKVTKMTPRPSIIPDSDAAIVPVPEPSPVTAPPPTNPKPEPGKPPSRAGACRVCLKSFKPDDFSRTCAECTQKVCEDCASYSKLDENEDQNAWKCSVCRRKLQSRIAIPQDSTDSLLEVPVLEALQRRHSDVKIGGGSLTVGGGGSLGLAPPRSPELRRHSDVSPASLKELEKLKGGNQKSNGSDMDWASRGRGSRSGAPSRSSSPPRRESMAIINTTVIAPPTIEPPAAPRGRRMSRVQRQHSYDDEIKSGGSAAPAAEAGLGLPAPMPRRASAYDVYAPGVLAAANQVAAAGPDRPMQSARRPSFRVPLPDEPTKDSSPSPEASPALIVEDDRRTRRRASQLPDIAALRALPQTPWSAAALEELEAPRRQASVDGEAIKIVIHDFDSDLPIAAAKRRVVLRKDPTDKAHRTRGFGMRVVGGKTGADGRLFAYIVWTVPGGPAEKGGLQQGDKVLEWCGVPLTDRSFEEVCAIMDRTGDVAELLVEHATDFRMCDLLEEPMPMVNRKSSDASAIGLQIGEPDSEKTPSSPTRRKLPKTPEQMAREKQVSGRVQLQVWYHDERRELVVAVLAGDDLAPRDDSLGYGSLPEAYAKLRLMPTTNEQYTVQTEVASANQNPIWNANLSFPGVPGDELMERSVEVTLWDLCPGSEPVFLGECTMDLQKAFLDDRAVWYRLEDPKSLRGAPPGKSPHTSPRGSIGGDVSRLMRRTDFQRSVSDDVDSIGECTSLLHPDHAWIAGSRRGSSQSEQLEVEVYELGKDFSRSLPGSRRSSFQSAKQDSQSDEVCAPPVNYNPGRRRSSCTRMLRDPDEILRSLKAVKGELGRTMSLSGNSDKRGRRTSTSSRKDSVMEIPEYSTIETNLPSDEGSPEGGSPTKERRKSKLGPGQIQPRGYRMSAGRHGELKLGLLMTKGQLEVDVVCAKNLGQRYTDNPPDTYVKCYLRDGERWLQKRKTRVARHSAEPHWRQTLRYSACDVLGRTLLVMLWERQGGFEHNQGIGGAEVALDSLTLTSLTVGWYPLFPIHSLGSDSNDSP